MVRRALCWLPALALMGAIAYSSHQSEWPGAVKGAPDWLLHGGVYAALAAALHFGCAKRLRPAPGERRCVWSAVLMASLYGASDEWHQGFIAGRDAAVGDWAADTVGAVLMAVLLTTASFAASQGVWED